MSLLTAAVKDYLVYADPIPAQLLPEHMNDTGFTTFIFRLEVEFRKCLELATDYEAAAIAARRQLMKAYSNYPEDMIDNCLPAVSDAVFQYFGKQRLAPAREA